MPEAHTILRCIGTARGSAGSGEHMADCLWTGFPTTSSRGSRTSMRSTQRCGIGGGPGHCPRSPLRLWPGTLLRHRRRSRRQTMAPGGVLTAATTIGPSLTPPRAHLGASALAAWCRLATLFLFMGCPRRGRSACRGAGTSWRAEVSRTTNIVTRTTATSVTTTITGTTMATTIGGHGAPVMPSFVTYPYLAA